MAPSQVDLLADDGCGGRAHARRLEGDLDVLVASGVPDEPPELVVEPGALQLGGPKVSPARVAHQEDDGRDIPRPGADVNRAQPGSFSAPVAGERQGLPGPRLGGVSLSSSSMTWATVPCVLGADG
jgi:hypothetical protein